MGRRTNRREDKRPPDPRFNPKRPVGWCGLHNRVLGGYWVYEIKHCTSGSNGPCKHFYKFPKRRKED